eukprot:g8876.t1
MEFRVQNAAAGPNDSALFVTGEEQTDWMCEAETNGIFRKTDWKCGSCSNINWEWRTSCNKCGQLKPSVSIELHKQREAARALRRPEEGRGGGFFDRQNQDEKRAWCSDDEEVDDFGRKKRKEDRTPGGGHRADGNMDVDS